MKERFSVSLDDELIKWIDDLIEQKIFSSRSHAIEFCVKQMSLFSIQDIIKLHWNTEKSTSIALSQSAVEKSQKIQEHYGFETIDESIRFALTNLVRELETGKPSKSTSNNSIPAKHSRIKTDS